MLNIIIFGAPGCGKGTQSVLIIEKFGLKHFSTGELLRKEIEAKTALGMEADKYISKGNLVPDEMIIDVITNAVQQLDADCKGIIFDGFPRTVKQAEELEKLMNGLGKPTTVLIDLQVSNRELISRLLTRGKTSGRSDDNLETIKKRLDVYATKTTPVNEYYQSLNKYAAIDGLGTVEEVFERIEAKLR
ncbi:MAG: adenylate kinase [Paludibacter sp.]|nr:adenylate kinase [Paludibacter sp.]MDD4199661.1 adenylate kinase [Paludibacter sp.]MDD4428569.1 adenylate kinase [Paludibacter sp.]